MPQVKIGDFHLTVSWEFQFFLPTVKENDFRHFFMKQNSAFETQNLTSSKMEKVHF